MLEEFKNNAKVLGMAWFAILIGYRESKMVSYWGCVLWQDLYDEEEEDERLLKSEFKIYERNKIQMERWNWQLNNY